MLSFNDYNNAIQDLEDEIELQKRKINYREIEMNGKIRCNSETVISNLFTSCISSSSNISSTGERQEIKDLFDTDLDYQRLIFHLNELKSRLAFIKEYAELPKEDMTIGNIYD